MSTACDAWLGRHKELLEWPGAGIGTQWSQELKGRLFCGENSFNFVLVLHDSLTYDLHLHHNLRNPTCQLLCHLAVQVPQRRNPGLSLSSTTHFRDDWISAQIVTITKINQLAWSPQAPLSSGSYIWPALSSQSSNRGCCLTKINDDCGESDIDMPKWYWHA